MKCPQCRADNAEGSRFCANCAAPLTPVAEAVPSSQTQTVDDPLPDLPRGSLFADRYEVIEELGSGGMGSVYKVYDKKLKEKVALKLIRPDLALRPKTLDRFRDEIRLARRITHKNVCRMHDISEERGTPFITMEYVPGEDLKSIIRMVEKLSPAQTIAIARQICAGLAEAHRLGTVHRDLKPRNIMIDREGTARIMDFGLARSLEEKGITDGRAMIGTPEYMSPEQAEGKPADERSDIYSLGVILFEMLTGRIPFDGDSALSIAIKHKTERPPDPRKLNLQVTEALSRLVLKCLEKDRGRRYQSVTEIQAELDELAKQFPSGEKVLPRSGSSARTAVSGSFLSKRALTAAGAVFLLAALALAVRFILIPRDTPTPAAAGKPSLAVLYFKNSTGDKDLDFLRETLVDYLIPELREATRQITTLSEESIKSVLGRLGLEDAAGYTTENLQAVTAKTRATYLLTAAYFRAGAELEIKYTLTDARNTQAIESGSVRGSEQEPGRLAAQLRQRVLVDLKLPGEAQVVKPNAPSVSLPAQRFYQQARQADRKYWKGSNSRDFEKALDFYDQALREEPRYALAYVGLGDLYQHSYVVSHKREDLDKALEYYQRGYGVEPESPGTNAGLGWAYYLRGDNVGAFSFFKRAFDFGPENPSSAADVGSFFRSIGLPGKAIQFYTRAIDRGGFYSAAATGGAIDEIHRLRATCCERLGETAKAVADARTWLELEPENIDAELFLARMLIGQRSLKEAEREIGVVERSDPANLNLKYTKALLFAARGDKARALPLIEEAKKDPVYFSYLLSRVYAGCGLKDDAIRIIRLGIDRGFEDTVSYLYEYPVLALDKFFDNLRGEPRFEEILSRQKASYEENQRKFGGL